MVLFVGVVVSTILMVIMLVKFVYPPLWRDLYTLFFGLRFTRNVKKACQHRQFLIDQFEKQAKKRANKVFILFKEERLTYADVDQNANRVARALMQLAIGRGDTVALVMSNEPAFVWIYLGVQKLGARIALINHHLVDDGLRHCILSCVPSLIIAGDGLDNDLPERVISLELDVPVCSYNTRPGQDTPSFSQRMAQVSSEPVDPGVRSRVQISDPCAFIFTSGTTGLPKPAIISHKKAIMCSHCYGPLGFSSREVFYLTLPLYHSSALNLALLNVIMAGATIVLRDKFSATHFWSDCSKYDVTSFQYIGEMLRYLVNSPEHPQETSHNLWAAVGNGLRLDIWTHFKSRFKIARIYEFYGSTEVPATVNNLFNMPGSVGRLSPLLSYLMKLSLVRVEPETGAPYRNEKGRCELVQPGGSGVLLARLSDEVTFEGYLGPASDTRKRILKDVLEEGDFYVTTNDVFTLDEDYNLYFKDRIGDSFRWKGENISTAEVSKAMNSAGFVQDTNVFGVEIPGCEGKAGMAAVNLKEDEELEDDKIDELGRLCRQKLPGYARPRFLRFQRQMSLTSTFKQQKTELAKEGYNPSTVSEPLYFLDRRTDTYRLLDDKTFREIVDRKVAL